MTYRRQERLFLFVRADRLSQRTRPRRSGPRPTLVFRSAPQATFTADARPCAADLCGPDGLPAGQADRRHRVAPRRWAHGQDQEGRLPVLIRVVEEELRLLLFLALRRFAGNVASRRNAIVDSAQTLPLQQAVILRAVAGSTSAPRRWPRPWLGRRGSCDCAQDDAFLLRCCRVSRRPPQIGDEPEKKADRLPDRPLASPRTRPAGRAACVAISSRWRSGRPGRTRSRARNLPCP